MRVLLLAGVLALSGCSVLVPDFSKKSSEAAPPPAAPETTEAPKNPALPNACELFDAEKELTAYQFKVTENIATVITTTCRWTHDADSSKSIVLSLNIYGSLSVDETPKIPTAKISDVTIGSRKGRLSEENDATCWIDLPSGKGHASIQARASDLAESCEIARSLADKIEPNLPA